MKLTWIILCAAFCGMAQAQPVRPIGAVRSVEAAGQQLRLRTENAWVELTAYSPSVIRVRIDKQALGRDFSYAVVASPQPTKVTVSQGAAEVVMATSALQVHVARQPFAIRFTTPDGKTINQDEPGLTTSWIGDEVSTYKTLQPGERFIGLGEKTGNLDRRGSAYTNWNTDAYRYHGASDPLYASFPFYLGVQQGLSYGIFFDNSYQSDFNFGASNDRFASFSAQGGEMNYYFIHHPKLADIIASYSTLTGRMPLPPLWALGYQQNRYSYYPETEVMRIAQTLREKRIPADGITLDIHYMDAYKLFTWDKARFPDPAGMTARLAALGFKTTVIVDPGIKIEAGYGAYERGRRDDVFIKYADGSNFSAQVWPGWCNFPDFTSEKGRAWWRKEVATYASVGVAGLWNDMNEIATWGQHMPNNLLFNFDGAPTTHKQGRNVFGLEMVRASYDGMKEATGERPFILSRAGFSGLQRYSAIWTGDNTATEEHMLLGVRLLTSLGLSGMPFAGMDVGGFMGGAPTRSMYARWMQIGAFTPYFRNHAANDTRSSEPWTYGEDVLINARDYIGLRYKLLPYLYSTFHEASSSGLPPMRSLAIDYTHDAMIYRGEFQNQYLFGPAFLVAPFEGEKQFGKIYFPSGKWYRLYDDTPQEGGQEKIVELSPTRLPVYVKAGSIVPMQSLVQSTSEKPSDTLALHVYQGDTATQFVYYEDDGSSFGYQKGEYHQRTISFEPATRRIVFGAVEGSYRSKFKLVDIILHGFGKTGGTVSFIDPASGQGAADEQCKIGSIVVNNDSKQFAVAY
ncbi:MAG: TIM-barrel domain-containing protein [Pseudomonadota bacterium]